MKSFHLPGKMNNTDKFILTWHIITSHTFTFRYMVLLTLTYWMYLCMIVYVCIYVYVWPMYSGIPALKSDEMQLLFEAISEDGQTLHVTALQDVMFPPKPVKRVVINNKPSDQRIHRYV